MKAVNQSIGKKEASPTLSGSFGSGISSYFWHMWLFASAVLWISVLLELPPTSDSYTDTYMFV